MVICKSEGCPVTGENKCCWGCDMKGSCKDACDYNPDICEQAVFTDQEEETALAKFVEQHMAVFKAVRDVVIRKKAAEEQEKALKDQLKKAMEAHGIKAVDNEILKITYVPETVSNGIDAAMIKRKYPTVAAECVKATPKSSYIKIEVKEGD